MLAIPIVGPGLRTALDDIYSVHYLREDYLNISLALVGINIFSKRNSIFRDTLKYSKQLEIEWQQYFESKGDEIKSEKNRINRIYSDYLSRTKTIPNYEHFFDKFEFENLYSSQRGR